MHEDFDRCYRAVQASDARFEGWFVTAVTTTRIYCRPSCPARTPLARNVTFYPTAAAAHHAGFRACKRCRPDASPGSPEWDVRQDVVARAMRLIADGVVEREGVAGLAGRLGYSPRHLERLLLAEVGAGPVALARANRAQTARVLVETTGLAVSEVAFGAGFSSIRQFNDTVRSVFGCTPTELRARAAGSGPRSGVRTPGSLAFRLAFRRPFVPAGLFGHLAATAVPGCEEVRAGSYRRTLRLPRGNGIVALRPHADPARAPHHLAGMAGIGAWTSEMIAMRALGDPDAFPASDSGVVKGAASVGLPVTPAALLARSRRWHPWRSYAVQYLWATLDHPANRWPPEGPSCN